MFNSEEYYRLYNSAALKEYEQQKAKVAEWADVKVGKGNRDLLLRFVKKQAEFLQHVMRWEDELTEEYIRSASLEQLAKEQDVFFREEEGEEYTRSILCPAVAVKQYGGELGPVISYIAYQMRENLIYAPRHMRFAMSWNQRLFLDIAELLVNHAPLKTMKECIESHALSQARDRAGLMLHERFIPDGCQGEDRIAYGDLQDPGFLYTLGRRVTKEDQKLFLFMNSLPEESIEKMASSFVEGFRKGFFVDAKDIVIKKTVGIYHRLGMERMTRKVMELFASEIHYRPFISRVKMTQKNQQCQYDHRFDMALIFNAEFGEKMNDALEEEVEQNASMLRLYGGPAVIDSFGEAPFIPKKGKGSITFSEEQMPAYTEYMNRRSELLYRYMPQRETSYTMVAYPVPQIGKDFAPLFEEMIQINTLDNEKYLQVQQHIIDALDQGVKVEIQGARGNETKLEIALAPIEDPKHQTNFYNCVADVNIPLGEIFTSPQLEGTNGVLHVESFYADGLSFKNLKLTFTDGYVTDYSCENFSTEEENRAFVRENLLFPHETLPMGEFAIGTNTLAYKMARQYDIVEQLPILIVEKMGPHFAVGDTCYVGTEELPVYNPQNGKEICARENEKTALRHADRENAYTHVHKDITLPYHGIGVIRVITSSGQMIEIIRNGRFVLRGTELLNEALRALEEQEEKQNETV